MSILKEWFCGHNYQTKVKEILHTDENGDPHFPELIIVQICKKCGKVKTTHIMPANKQGLYGCKGVK